MFIDSFQGLSLLDDPDAWAIMLEWASESIDFPTFDNKMQGFADRYVSSDWSSICNRVFDLSEDGNIAAAVAFVQDQMKSRGLIREKGKRKAEGGEHRPRHKKRPRRTVCFLSMLTFSLAHGNIV